MNSRIITLMAAGLGLCLTLTAWLAWSNWQLQQQIISISNTQQDETSQHVPEWLRRLETQSAPLSSTRTPAPPSIAWDPFAEMDRMQQQIDRWMQGAAPGLNLTPRSSLFSAATAQPDIRIEEDSDAYRVRISVPEGSELALDTEINERRLTVSGEVSAHKDETGSGSMQRFFSSSQFSRQFTLNDSLGIRKETVGNEVIITLPKV